MIDIWISFPIALRMFLLGLLGLAIGSAANHAIYRFAWYSRPISPWGPAPEGVAARVLADRIPLIGWMRLRRESEIHGSGFWIRPIMIEVALAVGIPSFYWFLTQTGAVLPLAARTPAGIQFYEPWLTTVFASQTVLVSLMVAATFIDFDEQTIPDLLTVPGTLIALISGCLSLNVFMPSIDLTPAIVPITFYVPATAIAPEWNGPLGWWTGLGIWTGWCFALANRRVILRRGWIKAIEYFAASLVRYPTWKFLLAMWIVGAVAIRVVFAIKGPSWTGLLTALVGLGVGGGVVWAIRVVGSAAMRREALGFGDVTLMAMIGAFIGWQGAVTSFFLAPIAAVAIVLVYFMITRNSEIPFGPYLCAGTMLTIIWWDPLVSGWFLENLAVLGPFMLWLFIALTGMMGVMLFFWRIIKESLIREE